MKKILIPATIAVSMVISLASCNSSKASMADRKQDIELSRETTASCFVQMNDGTIRKFTTLKLKTGVLKAPHLLGDDSVKIGAKDILAYQNHAHYAISQKNFVSGHKTYVATETLPGFAIRIAKGNINVYTKKYYNGTAAVDEYFVQKGTDGSVLAYTAETMNLLVKDDAEALDFFMTKKYSTPKSKKDPIVASYAKNNKPVVKK